MEFNADECSLKAYSMSSQDARAKPLLDLGIDRQLKLFRNMEILSIDDYKTVCDFKTKRNDLFHTGGLFVFPNLTNEEKEQIYEIGERALNIMEKLSILLGERQKGRYFYPTKNKGDNYDK